MKFCPPVLCWRNLSGARMSWGSHHAARPENSGTVLFLSGGLNSVRSQVKKSFFCFTMLRFTTRVLRLMGVGGVFVVWPSLCLHLTPVLTDDCTFTSVPQDACLPLMLTASVPSLLPSLRLVFPSLQALSTLLDLNDGVWFLCSSWSSSCVL